MIYIQLSHLKNDSELSLVNYNVYRKLFLLKMHIHITVVYSTHLRSYENNWNVDGSGN